MNLPNPRKLYLAFTFLLVSTLIAKSQDLIVTKDADSIECKITRIDTSQIEFTVTKGKKFRTYLPMGKVTFYDQGFYTRNTLGERTQPYRKSRLALDFGLSFRTAKIYDGIPTSLREYTKQLKSGFTYGANFTGFFNENNGIGFKYSLHSSKNEMGTLVYGTMNTLKDHIKITYIAPFYSYRVLNPANNNAWFFNTGLGYLAYKDDYQVATTSSTIKGSTLGLNLDLGYDFMLSPGFAMGFQISYVVGTLTKYEDGRSTIELDEDDYESLNRIDITFGIRFY